jgi:signal transduction histidine kinase
MAYSIVQHNAFKIEIAGAQILVITLSAFVGSLLFVETELIRYVATPTLLFSLVAGFLLIRSIKKEFIQRKQLEDLTKELEKANVRLQVLDKQKSEFVSIASHQLRSPLTAIRGYASLLLEGSYGELSKKAQEPLSRIEESSKLMAFAIEDYLNVSRIESGNMKYNLSDFSLRDQVEHTCDDMRSEAIKHGLVLLFRTHLSSRGIIHADLGKSVQIIQNLINNAVKYTPEGTIIVIVRDDVKKKKVFVDVTDTGMGMSEETQQVLFQKFARAHNANTVDTTGTGLGLFVADKMAEAMGGNIEAYSEGEGKGSRFTLSMPLTL